MKKNTGWVTTIGLAMAAIFGLSVLPSRNAAPTAGGSGGAPQQKTAPASEPATQSLDLLKPPCREIETRILEFLPENKHYAPEDCYEKPGQHETGSLADEKDGAHLRFIIATLPNPVHTHFPLEFNRLADALQKAAQDQGYNYDSSWLPWVEQPRQYSGLNDQEQAEKRLYFREKQPGVLVFRSALPSCPPEGPGFAGQPGCDRPYRDGLLIFVVGENPTGGIDGEQFEHAIDWIAALRRDGTGHSLRILSPYFSGSFPSLARLLTSKEEIAHHPSLSVSSYVGLNKKSVSLEAESDTLSSVEVFSGAASSTPGIQWFSRFLKEKQLGRFLTFQENDDLLINRYCRLLTQQRYDTGRLAIVSEDETAYGAIGPNAQPGVTNPEENPDPALYECVQHDAKGARGPLNLYYPRDIASLRSAYAKQSVFGSGQPGQQGGRTGLSENLSEPDSSEHDTIRTYGGEQTPLSDESTLLAMVPLLKAHHIEFILLRSSNGLDQIFLTQFFARAYPDARVVINNSDLMFHRSTQSQGFRGTMTLSSYPLLTWQQDWTYHQAPESRHSHRAFPDSDAEGVYLASRFLIHLKDSELNLDAKNDAPLCLRSSGLYQPSSPPVRDSSVVLQDYGPPSWLLANDSGPTRPPTWLSVLGNGEIWPVAIIDEDLLPARLNPPKLSGASGQSLLPAGVYYVSIAYFGGRKESAASQEASFPLSRDQVLTVKAPEQPAWAEGYKVYIGEISGSETLQGSVIGWEDYKQRSPLSTMDSKPPENTTLSVLAPAYTGATIQKAHLLVLPLPTRFCFSIAFVWCLFHLYACWTGSQTGYPRYRAYFAPAPGPQHNILIFFGCTLFALLAIVMAVLTGTPSSGESPFMHAERMTILYVLLVLLSMVAVAANYLKTPRPRRVQVRTAEKDAEDKYGKARTDEENVRTREQKLAEKVAATKTPQSEVAKGAEEKAGKKEGLRARRASLVKKTRHKLHHWVDQAGQWLCNSPWKLALLAALFFLIVTSLLGLVFYHMITLQLVAANRVFTFWRSVNLLTGVSPLVPFLLLIVGLYAWFWYTLSGVALFNQDRPKLPSCCDLDMRLPMFTRERSGNKIERLAKPISGGYGVVLPGLFLGLVGMFIFFAWSEGLTVRSLGAKSYGVVYFVWLSVCIALIVADAFQLLRVWGRLRQLLVYLDRMPLRRTLHALKGFSWGTVWKMGGSVLERRYKLLSRQMESFRHLKNELERLQREQLAAAVAGARGQSGTTSAGPDTLADIPVLKESFYKRLATCDASGAVFGAWYINSYRDPRVTDLKPLERHQEELAKTAAAVCNEILLPKWRAETHSLIQNLSHAEDASDASDRPEFSFAPVPEYQRLAEEFFALPYLGFVQNILGRTRTIAMGMLWLFVAATISVASYPFDPRPFLGGIFLFVFGLVGAIIFFVYAGMHRDTTLSYVTNTNPGELGTDFWIKLIALGAGPLLALLTALFPDAAGFVTSWLMPGVQAIK